MRRWDAVIFDLDGVLVDSRVPFARGINAALSAHGVSLRPEHELHGYLGPPLHSTFERLVGRGPIVQSCVDTYRERYRAMAATETPVFDGMRDLVASLAGRVPLVVATSKPRALAEPPLVAPGLRQFFTAVVGPSLDAENERKTATIGRALRELTAARRAVMVGDREFDISAGREHGLATIGVLWGIGTESELRDAGADLLARSPAELAELLAETDDHRRWQPSRGAT